MAWYSKKSYGGGGFNDKHCYEFGHPPEDTVSKVRFASGAGPTGGWLLAASSWDGSLRVWEVQQDASKTQVSQTSQRYNSQALALFKQESPVLSTAWADYVLFSGQSDGSVKMHDLKTRQEQLLGKHDAAVSSVAVSSAMNVIFTGSFDGTIRVWDGRQQGAVHTFNPGCRVFDLDTDNHALVAVGSEQKVVLYNLNNPGQPQWTPPVQLKLSLRRVACHPHSMHYAVGGTEGRLEWMPYQESDRNDVYTVKAHPTGAGSSGKLVPVHDITFHPTMNFGVSCASDHSLFAWATEKRRSTTSTPTTRFKQVAETGRTATTCDFSPDGSAVAFGLGYDWTRGYEKGKQSAAVSTQVAIRLVPSDDFKSVVR
ncbi:MAG: hypothetical protein KVP17_000450 [Porospora cf. gigantea B]|uniref:uncharacterized protein n=1 Tax=Porospora cf. gigantea B TaxID=2853592 RepID=UPI003571B9A4|nr:MAG: hypothetical protein KVP17_000450 [Porospora cf. gigantea B]